MLHLLLTLVVAVAPTHPDSAQVADVIARFHAALEAGDSATVLRLLDPGVVIMEAGGVETLHEYRSHHLKSDIEFARAVKTEHGPVRVEVSGKAAWAWSTSRTSGTFRERAIDTQGAEMVTLRKSGDGWRITGIHWSSRRVTGTPGAATVG